MLPLRFSLSMVTCWSRRVSLNRSMSISPPPSCKGPGSTLPAGGSLSTPRPADYSRPGFVVLCHRVRKVWKVRDYMHKFVIWSRTLIVPGGPGVKLRRRACSSPTRLRVNLVLKGASRVRVEVRRFQTRMVGGRTPGGLHRPARTDDVYPLL